MTCEQAITYIHSKLRFGVRPGLSRIRALLEKIGNPHKNLAVIHVAGTNGKGSTCAMIGSILRSHGYKTGYYYSPYITDFRDRMQINGRMIGQRALAGLVAEIQPYVEEMEGAGETVTEFELVTAIAFLWFARSGCERVVLEVGLGGRWDATNVVDTPLLSVITPIGLDHTQILGDTLSKIASEKCGIIKTGGKTVCAVGQEEEAMEVIRRICQERDNTLIRPEPLRLTIQSMSLNGTEFFYAPEQYRLRMPGRYQCDNAMTAIEAARALDISEKHIQRGLAQAVLPARMEVVSENPFLLLDGAHNPAAARVLRQSIESLFPKKKIVAVMGMMADKDCAQVVSILAPLFSRIYVCSPRNPRALSAAALAELVTDCDRQAVVCSLPEDALAQALAERGRGEGIVICGSFYLAGDLREALDCFTEKEQ